MLANVNNTFLEYDTFGIPNHEALLLISGLNTPMTRWTQQFCEQLAASGFYVIRYNNRDTGRSEHFSQQKHLSTFCLLLSKLVGLRIKLPYSMNDMVCDGIALLDHLGIKQAHIVGRSMGGFIAQIMASAYPLRALSLTAIMSTSGNRALPKPSLKVMRLLIKKTPNPNADLEGYLQHRIEYTRAIGSQSYPTSDTEVRKRIKQDLTHAGYNPGAGRRQLAAMIQAGDIRHLLHTISCPTLILHGECDPLVPLACGLDIHKNIQHSTMRIIKDMGHSLHPHFFDELIDEIRSLRISGMQG